MSPSDFINLCLMTGASYEKLDNKQKAFDVLLRLIPSVELGDNNA